MANATVHEHASSLLNVYSFFELRSLFYLVLPAELAYTSLNDVSLAVSATGANIFPFYVLELALAFCERTVSANFDAFDCYGSVIAMMLAMLEKSFFRMSEFALYAWVYERFALCAIAPDSVLLFVAAFFAIDFIRYWIHRAWHENNVLWQFHKLHHSAEYMNLFMGPRTNYIQDVLTMFLFTPLALVVPPAQFYLHYYLNYFYPWWVHTTLIPKFRWWPFERFIVTPSHHRVHHGRNRYCIDRNYGSVLIVWDLLFGTFAEERDDEPVLYGLVEPVTTFNMARMHFDLSAIFAKVRSVSTVEEKMKALAYGPGWAPGTGRLGNLEDIPEVKHSSLAFRFYVPHSFPSDLPFLVHCLIASSLCLHVVHKDSGQFLGIFGYFCAYCFLYTYGDTLDRVDGATLSRLGVAHGLLVVYAIEGNYDFRLALVSAGAWLSLCTIYAYRTRYICSPQALLKYDRSGTFRA